MMRPTLHNSALSSYYMSVLNQSNDLHDTDSVDRVSPRSDSGRGRSESPRLQLPNMSPERRSHVIQLMRKHIPIVAKQRRDEIKEAAKYASLCIHDAFAGRLKNGLATNSKKSWLIYTAFRIQTSDLLFQAVVIASVCHSLSVFFEPANQCLASFMFNFFQAAVISIYAFDVALKMYYEGVHEYFKHDWQMLYVTNLCLHALDLYFSGCTYWCNPLRPVAGVLRARRGRKFFEVLKMMVPEMIHNMVPILFFVIIVMAICSAVYDSQVEEFTHTSYTFYNWWFLVLTNDNFSRLLPERLYQSLSYLLYFFPGIYVGQRFLLNLIIGDTYGTYKNYVKKQLEKERQKEMQGLTKAFSALDVEEKIDEITHKVSKKGTGHIPPSVWFEALAALQPDLPHEAIALYFELISGGEDHITVLQFLKLHSVLNFKLTVHTNSKNSLISFFQQTQSLLLAGYNNLRCPFLSQQACIWGGRVLEYCKDNHLFIRGNLLDILLLATGYSEFTVIYGLTCCQILALGHCLEYAIRLLAADGHFSKVTLDTNFITTLFSIGTIVSLLFYPVLMVEDARSFELAFTIHVPVVLREMIIHIRGDKILLIMRLFRCLRLANLNPELRNFTSAIVDILPALGETFFFTFIVTYIYGLAGNLLFGRHMIEWSTPLLGVVKAQQLTFMVDFLGSMETAMETVSELSVFFFVSFLILSMTVSNIALSIIIDLHANVLDMKTNKERSHMRKKMDMMFNTMKDNARKRQIFTKSKMLNFSSIRMSDFQSSDVRKFITGHGEDEIRLEDIEKCKKESNMDIVQFFKDTHRHHKDLHKEAEFMNTLHDAGFKVEIIQRGELLFEVGQKADKLYYLVKGSVVLFRPPLKDKAMLHAITFVGGECLQPGSSTYQVTCLADVETTVLAFTQEDLMHDMDSDLSGLVIQKAFKSFGQIEAAFAESSRASKKLRRGILINPAGGSGENLLTHSDSYSAAHSPPPHSPPPPPVHSSSSSSSYTSSSSNNNNNNNNNHHHDMFPMRPIVTAPISGAAVAAQHALR